jgi:hypothetical protein
MSGENYIKDGNIKKMHLNVLNGKKIEKSYSQKMVMAGGGLQAVKQNMENIKDLPK